MSKSFIEKIDIQTEHARKDESRSKRRDLTPNVIVRICLDHWRSMNYKCIPIWRDMFSLKLAQTINITYRKYRGGCD